MEKNLHQRGQAVMIAIIGAVFVGVIAIYIIGTMTPVVARTTLENAGFVVLESTEYTTLLTRVNAIKAKTDTLPASPANEVTAAAAVVNAQNAVIAAQLAAAKVDLFNSAEVFLFPATTNITVTLTAGNTNAWSAWAEITDNLGSRLSTNFTSNAGYISDMYIYDHSAVDKLYMVELAYGAAKSILGRVSYHTSFIEMAPIKSRRIPAGETVYYRMMCSGANGATAKVGFRYFYE